MDVPGRPWANHKRWQGRVYSTKAGDKHPDIHAVCGLGEVDGLEGANCRHLKYPFWDGISERTYTDQELANIDPPAFTYKGKRYEHYDATQRQRAIERRLRRIKRQMVAYEAAGDNDAYRTASIRHKAYQDEYREFCKAGNLVNQEERSYIREFGPNGGNNRADNSGVSERGSGKITQITEETIQKVPLVRIPGYSEEECVKIQELNRQVLHESMENNNCHEVAIGYSSDFSRSARVVGGETGVDLGNMWLGSGTVVSHNHPRNSTYSMSDLGYFVCSDEIRTILIAKNNGSVEALTKTDLYDSMNARLLLDRMAKKMVKQGTDAEYDFVVKKFIEKMQNGGVMTWTK